MRFIAFQPTRAKSALILIATMMAVALLFAIFANSVPAAAQTPESVSFGNFKLTVGKANYPHESVAAVQNEFGSEWRVADWNDLRAAWSAYQEDIKTAFSDGAAIVTWNGEAQWGNTARTFFVEDHNGSKPGYFLAHDQLGGNEVSLGSWTIWEWGGDGLRTLAIRKTGAGTPAPAPSHPGDKAALVALYNATGGANWTDNTNWLSDKPIGEWHGVTTNDDGRVIDLGLGENNLVGAMPAELGNLSELKGLNLGSNQLRGAIPPSLGNLSNLNLLYLWNNHLSGGIPPELGNLSNLTGLALQANDLTGGIPSELSRLSRLEHLGLFGNQLSGPIPSWLGSLSNIREIWLGENQLTGAIPTELGNLSNLTELHLWRNQLSGNIPVELGNLSSLTQLELGRNQLNGEIPAELGNLANLEKLSVSGNQLSGEIPSELGNLSNLEQLYIRENQFSGNIPVELGNLSALTRLYIHDNRLSGEIPSSLTRLTSLEHFHFANNDGICAPTDADFQTWLQGISDRDDGPNCADPSPPTPATGRIAFVSTREGDVDIHVMNADGTGVTRLTGDEAFDWNPSWSPDGRRIAFNSFSGRGTNANRDIYLMNADGSNIARLTFDSAPDIDPSWSPDGRRIAFTSHRDGNTEIYIINADGTGSATNLTNNSATDGHPAWSPDGQRIAFVSSRAGNDEVYVMNADGTGINRLTNDSAVDWEPSWSPDSQRVAFSSAREGRNRNIFVKNADGTGSATRLTDHRADDDSPSWSPDGQHIAFTSGRDGNPEIYLVSADGSSVTRLTNHPADDFHPSWSPVGTPTPPADDECETELTEDGSVEDSWSSYCASENRENSFAHYYTFTLTEAAEVTITLESAKDTYLFLLRGAGKDGAALCENDDYTDRIGGAPCGLIDSDLDSDLDSGIVANLGAGDYTIEATTYVSGETGDFTLAVSGIDGDTQPPLTFSMSIDPGATSVGAGQYFDLEVRIHDVRGRGENGGVSVSFPQLTDAGGSTSSSYSSDVADVEFDSYTTGLEKVTFYQPGSTIYNKDNAPFPARHLLVETADTLWRSASDRTLRLRITPKLEGELRILIRGWICEDEYDDCERQPAESGYGVEEDQQGWLAEDFTVNVLALSSDIPDLDNPERHAKIDSCGVGEQDFPYFQPGDNIRLSAKVSNENAGLLGADLYVMFILGNGQYSSNSRVSYVLKGGRYEFQPSGQDEGSPLGINKEGTMSVRCILMRHNGSGLATLQDYMDAEIYIDKTHDHIRRLVNRDYVGQYGWTIDANLKSDNRSRKELILAVEGKTRTIPLPYYSMLSFTVRVPETVWVDYGSIVKYIAASDGRYFEYTAAWENAIYNQRAFYDALVNVLPGWGQGSAIKNLFNAVANDNVLSPGTASDNCFDRVDIHTLIPSTSEMVRTAESLNKSPKRILVKIPIYSLEDDDYISLSVTNNLFSAKIGKTYDDLMKTGLPAPGCVSP